MSEPIVRPCGSWASPVSPRMLATSSVSLSEPWIDEGAVYWHESRPAEGGRGVVVRGGPWSSPVDVTPEGFNVRSRVHEYGGGAWTVRRGVVVFSHDDDRRLYRQDPGEAPIAITPDTDGLHRYADGRISADGERWSACGSATLRRAGSPTWPTSWSCSRSTVPANRARSPRAATSTPRRASLRTDVGCRGSAGTCRGCRGTGASSGSRTWRPTARSARSVGWPGGTGEGVDLAAELESVRRTRLRERPLGVVEPRALHRGRTWRCIRPRPSSAIRSG